MRALITGAGGAAAFYLTQYLEARGDEVNGIGRPLIDLRNIPVITAVLEGLSPEVIYHLASDADVRASFEHPQEVISNNVDCTVGLFEAIRKSGLKPVVQICSTSEVYGNATHHPIGEEWPIAPVNPYASSKAMQEIVASTYGQMLGVPIVITRAFGYVNPRRSDLSLTRFARQIARIELGRQEVLEHGNLASIRSFCDVRDIVRAYACAADLGEGIYNIGSEEPMSIWQALQALMRMARVPIKTRLCPELMRPTDITHAVPTCHKFRLATGWEPKISFAESLSWLLDEQRARERLA